MFALPASAVTVDGFVQIFDNRQAAVTAGMGCGSQGMCYQVDSQNEFSVSAYAFDAGGGQLADGNALVPSGSSGKVIAIARSKAAAQLMGKEASYKIFLQGDKGQDIIVRTVGPKLSKLNSAGEKNVFDSLSCFQRQKITPIQSTDRVIHFTRIYCFYFINEAAYANTGDVWAIQALEVNARQFSLSNAYVGVKHATFSFDPIFKNVQSKWNIQGTPEVITVGNNGVVEEPTFLGQSVLSGYSTYQLGKTAGCLYIAQVGVTNSGRYISATVVARSCSS